jgi:hypothetical protein
MGHMPVREGFWIDRFEWAQVLFDRAVQRGELADWPSGRWPPRH